MICAKNFTANIRLKANCFNTLNKQSNFDRDLLFYKNKSLFVFYFILFLRIFSIILFAGSIPKIEIGLIYKQIVHLNTDFEFLFYIYRGYAICK